MRVGLTRVNTYCGSFLFFAGFLGHFHQPKSFGNRSSSPLPITEPRRIRNVEGRIVGCCACPGRSRRHGRLSCLARLRYTPPSQAHCHLSQRRDSTTMGLLYDDCTFPLSLSLLLSFLGSKLGFMSTELLYSRIHGFEIDL